MSKISLIFFCCLFFSFSVAFASFGLIMFASQIQKYYTPYSSDAGHIWWGFVLACAATAVLGLSATLMLMAHKLRLLTDLRRDQGGQFAHRQFSNSSFFSNVRLPDYSESGQDLRSGEAREHGQGLAVCPMPPAYETVVNCGDPDAEREEAPPPSYSQVVISQFGSSPPTALPSHIHLDTNTPTPCEQ